MFSPKKSVNLIVIMLLVISLIISGCGAPKENTVKKAIPKPKADKNIRIGIALSPPGKGDKATNDSALAGLEKAKTELGIEYKVIEPKELVDEEETIRYLAENNFDLIIVVGFSMLKPLNDIAPEYPNKNFAILDEVVDQPNVTSITFREQEGSYLAGVLAASLTKTNTVGFIGGANLDLIHKYENGFRQGVIYVNQNEKKNIQLLSNYLGLTVDAFNDNQLGRNMADLEFSNNADVVFHAARNSSQGIIDSAKANKRLVIGSDINQNDLAPGVIYASMVKKAEVVVFETVQKLIKGELKRGQISYGLAQNGIGFEFPQGTPPEITDKINGIQQKIIKGELKVND